MKQIFTLILAAVFANSLMAQSSKSTSKQLKQHNNFVNAMMQKQASVPGEKSTLTERVIAQSTHDNVAVSKTDSVKLNYLSTSETSTYDYNMMLYGYNYPYNYTPMFNYQGIFAKPQVQSNYYSHWTVDPNTLVYGFFEKDLSSYDINLNLVKDTTVFADSSTIQNMTFNNKFNAANNIDSGYSYNYHSGVSSNAFKQFFSYNTSNLITKDSIYAYNAGGWHFASKTFYSYDVSNNLILIDNYSNISDTTYTSPLIHQLQYMNTYDGSNRLLTVQTSYFDGTAFKPYVKDTFAYTGVHTFHTSWKQYQYDAINSYWAPITYMTKILNGAGLPVTINIQSFDSLANAWVPNIKQTAKYDSYNNPDTLDEYDYNFTSFPATPNFSTYYHYQTFSLSTLGVNEIAKANGNIKIYPNPNNGIMQMNYTIPDQQTAVLTIYDMTGRSIAAYPLTGGKNTMEINESHLDNGIYFYRLIANNQLLGSDKIVIVK